MNELTNSQTIPNDIEDAFRTRLGLNGKNIVIASGLFTTVGGDVNESITVIGCRTTDVAIATINTVGATPRTITTTAANTGKIDIVLSGDPSSDHIINYIVIRP